MKKPGNKNVSGLFNVKLFTATLSRDQAHNFFMCTDKEEKYDNT